MKIENHDFFVINDFNYTYKNHFIKMYPEVKKKKGLSISGHFEFYIASFSQILIQDGLRHEQDEQKIQARLKRNFNTYYSTRCIYGNLNPDAWYIGGINPIGSSKIMATNFEQGLLAIKNRISEIKSSSSIDNEIPYFYWHMYLCSLMNNPRANILNQESFYELDLNIKTHENRQGKKTFEQYLQTGIDKGWFTNVDNEALTTGVSEEFYQLFWREIIKSEKNLDMYYPK